jgi:molybdenum cofactor cytidylyltransferase
MSTLNVGAVVMAAGASKRMGQPKMILKWGGGTLIEQVVRVLSDSQVSSIVVVTGGAHDQVVDALRDFPVTIVHNQRYAETEMLQSLQLGLSALPADIQASLVVLGDQPQISADVVEGVVRRFVEMHKSLVVPSYQMRRGHPWLVARAYWDEIMRMGRDESLREFLAGHAVEIDYLVVDTPAILTDMDTPEDYQRDKPD